MGWGGEGWGKLGGGRWSGSSAALVAWRPGFPALEALAHFGQAAMLCSPLPQRTASTAISRRLPGGGREKSGERGGLHVAAAMAVVIIPSRSARRLKPALAHFLRAVMPDMLGVQKGDKSLRNWVTLLLLRWKRLVFICFVFNETDRAAGQKCWVLTRPDLNADIQAGTHFFCSHKQGTQGGVAGLLLDHHVTGQ